MKIASITPIYSAEPFVRGHFNMLKDLDINIVLDGQIPFKDYLAAGIYKQQKDNAINIIKEEYKHVHVIPHNFEYLCGDLFNLGLNYAKTLGADVIIKLDPDMFLTKKDWDLLINKIKAGDYDKMTLDFRKCTVVYKTVWSNYPKLDFKHGVSCDVFDVGNDTLVAKTEQRFVQDDQRIYTTGNRDVLIDWDDFVIHHFSGFKPNCDENELKRIETLTRFNGWVDCPQEIINMFN